MLFFLPGGESNEFTAQQPPLAAGAQKGQERRNVEMVEPAKSSARFQSLVMGNRNVTYHPREAKVKLALRFVGQTS